MVPPHPPCADARHMTADPTTNRTRKRHPPDLRTTLPPADQAHVLLDAQEVDIDQGGAFKDCQDRPVRCHEKQIIEPT